MKCQNFLEEKGYKMAIDPFIEKLTQVKAEETNTSARHNEACQALSNCSYIDDPAQWMNLLKVVTDLAIKLNDIQKELRALEHCHVVNNHGTLPY
uniref:Uncharacterized protein n=1 Tax=Rotaria sordida TaxID=392033 RepID=A0A815FLY2_9BILA|nr:unnamed protein product [Rotaria sordida]CAF4056572.1 unnamed protein product [Rotaria sordida]